MPADLGIGPSEVRIVFVTVPTADAGKDLARAVVDARLAACGNVIPGLTSVYRWEGAIEEDEEALVFFKTTKASVPKLMEKVVELHPYDVPEFLAVPVLEGHGPYLDWVAKETGNLEEQ